MPIRSNDYPRPSSVDAVETADANPGQPRALSRDNDGWLLTSGTVTITVEEDEGEYAIVEKVRLALNELARG